MLPQTASQPLNASAPRYTPDQVAREQAAFVRKVIAIMAAGLTVTGVTAMVVTHASSEMHSWLRTVYLLALFAYLGIGIFFRRIARNMSAIGAASLFYAFAIATGVVFSSVLLRYTAESISSVFFITAGTFAGFAAYGYLTKRDLSSWGAFLFQALWGIILASFANIFLLHSSSLYMGISYVGVLTFVGLTAYDVQKLKAMRVMGDGGSDADTKEAIHGALELYLDFVNLFLYLLRIMGRRR